MIMIVSFEVKVGENELKNAARLDLFFYVEDA